MSDCRTCKKTISDGNMLECKNCGAVFCSACARQTKNICPHCYSDLEYIG